jgi:hypothetical protein
LLTGEAAAEVALDRGERDVDDGAVDDRNGCAADGGE